MNSVTVYSLITIASPDSLTTPIPTFYPTSISHTMNPVTVCSIITVPSILASPDAFVPPACIQAISVSSPDVSEHQDCIQSTFDFESLFNTQNILYSNSKKRMKRKNTNDTQHQNKKRTAKTSLRSSLWKELKELWANTDKDVVKIKWCSSSIEKLKAAINTIKENNNLNIPSTIPLVRQTAIPYTVEEIKATLKMLIEAKPEKIMTLKRARRRINREMFPTKSDNIPDNDLLTIIERINFEQKIISDDMKEEEVIPPLLVRQDHIQLDSDSSDFDNDTEDEIDWDSIKHPEYPYSLKPVCVRVGCFRYSNSYIELCVDCKNKREGEKAEEQKLRKITPQSETKVPLFGGALNAPSLNNERDMQALTFIRQGAFPPSMVPNEAIARALRGAARLLGLPRRVLARDQFRAIRASGQTGANIAANIFTLIMDANESVTGQATGIVLFRASDGSTKKGKLTVTVSLTPSMTDDEKSRAFLAAVRESEKGQMYPGDAEAIIEGSFEHLPVGTFINLSELRLLTVQYRSWFLDKFSDLENNLNGTCVLDYLWESFVRAKYMVGKQGITKRQMQEQLEAISGVGIEEGVTVDELQEWVDKHQYLVNVFALSGDNMTVFHQKRVHGKAWVSLTFIVARNHLYPITNPEMREIIYHGHNPNQFIDMVKTQFVADTTDHVFVSDDCMLADCGSIKEKVIYTDVDLDEFLDNYLKTHDHICDQVIVNSVGQITKMWHPEHEKIIIRHESYNEIKKFLEVVRETYNGYETEFRGQTETSLMRTLEALIIGEMPRTVNTDKQSMFEDLYSIVPLVQQINSDIEEEKISVIDMNRCYTKALTCTGQDFLIFTPCDTIKIVTEKNLDDPNWFTSNKLYYCDEINDPILKCRFSRQTYTWELLGFMIKTGMTTKKVIRYYRECRAPMSRDTYRKIVQFVEDTCIEIGAPKFAKRLINSYIGCMNITEGETHHGYVTTDDAEAVALFFARTQEGEKVLVSKRDGYTVLRVSKKYTKRTRSSHIYTQVVCNAIKMVLEQALLVKEAGCEVTGLKVDAVQFLGEFNIGDNPNWKTERYKKIATETWAPARNVMEYEQLEWNTVDREEFINKVVNEKQNILLTGAGGAGKTTLLCKTIKALIIDNPTIEIVICAPSYKALDVIKTQLKNKNIKITKGQELNIHKDLMVCDSYEIIKDHEDDIKVDYKLELRTIQSIKAGYDYALSAKRVYTIRYDIMIIDEYSMINTSTHMMLNKYKGEVQFILSGDDNQCPPVDKSMPVLYKMSETNVTKSLCDRNHCHLEPLVGMRRGDDEITRVGEYLRQHHKLPIGYINKQLDMSLKINVVRTNKMKDLIWAVHDSLEFKPGQKVLAEFMTFSALGKKYVASRIYNSSTYYLHYPIGKNHWAVSEEEPDLPRPRKCNIIKVDTKHLKPVTATTVQKKQGDTIREKYNILEASEMNYECFYTALSRGLKMDDVHFDGKLVGNKVFDSVYDRFGKSSPVDYKPVPTYKIKFDKEEYIVLGDGYNTITQMEKALKTGVGCVIPKRAYKKLEAGEKWSLTEHKKYTCTNILSLTKTIMADNGKVFEFVCAKINTVSNFMDKKIPVRKDKAGFRSVGKLGDVNISIRVKSKEKAEELRQEELNYYYGDLCPTEKPDELTYKIKTNRKKTSDINIEHELINIKIDSEKVHPKKIPFLENPECGDQKLIHLDNLNWYRIQAPALFEARTQGKMMVKWVEKARTEQQQIISEQVAKNMGRKCPGKDAHYFTAIKRSDFISNIKTLPKAYNFETIHENVRMFADIDMARDECPPGITAKKVLAGVIDSIDVYMKGRFDIKKLRVTSACTTKKISFHLVYLGEHFKNVEDQRQMWVEIGEVAKKVAPFLWFLKLRKDGELIQCAIDQGVYTKNRAMRTIYSSKDGKDNELKPLDFETWTPLINLTNHEISEYLVSTNHRVIENSMYAKSLPNIIKKNIINRPKSYTKVQLKLNKDSLEELKKYKLPEGLTLEAAVLKDNGIVELVRQGTGLCPCCSRQHSSRDGFLFKRHGIWMFGCNNGQKGTSIRLEEM